MSLSDSYIAAVEVNRDEKDHFFAHSGYSPLSAEQRETFTALDYWPPDPAYQMMLALQPADLEIITFQTSDGAEREYRRIGTVSFDVAGEAAALAVYEDDEAGLFLPFRDSTSGNESYGAGRYLEPIRLDGDEILVDFNLAYNPFCAYSPEYSCPLPPIENWLKVPIRAGEKNFKVAGDIS